MVKVSVMYHTSVGINGRFDTLQAAILLEKLTIFTDEISKRQQIAEYYSSLLKSQVITPRVEVHNTCVYAQYTIRVKERADFRAVTKSRYSDCGGLSIAINQATCITRHGMQSSGIASH